MIKQLSIWTITCSILFPVYGRSNDVGNTETTAFLNWLVNEYLHTGKKIKLSRYKNFLTEQDFKGWTANDYYKEWTKDNPPGTISLICGTPVNYQSSELDFLKEKNADIDTAFLLRQIKQQYFKRWSYADFGKANDLKLISKARDPRFTFPYFFHVFTDIIHIAAVQKSLWFSNPIFSADKKYVCIIMEQWIKSNNSSAILIFEKKNNNWVLLKKIEENVVP